MLVTTIARDERSATHDLRCPELGFLQRAREPHQATKAVPHHGQGPITAHPGSWRATKRFGGKEFSLLIPAVATMAFQKNDQQYWITGLPQCHYFCALTVRLSDKRAALGLDSVVAQRRFEDSANNDPDLTAYEPGPATRLTIGDAPALLLEANCGDCTGGTVFVARGARVGAIEYNVDDREGYQPALVCRLVAIAKTFRWSS